MNILHMVKLFDRKANGIRTVVPSYVYEQAKYENVFLQNITGIKIECEEYQLDFEMNGWPFNIKDKQGNSFMPDLVVFHGFYHIEMVKLSKVLCKNEIPYIVVPHGSLTKDAQNSKKLKKTVGNILIFNRYLKKANAVQFLSQSEYENSNARNKNKYLSTNGVYMPNNAKEEFSDEGLNFTFIGRLEMHMKGIDLLVKAIAQKKEFLKEYNCKFNFYGPHIPIYQTNIDMINSLALENDVSDLITMHDSVFGEEKVEKLLDADVFIQTSRYEGMPMGILEAMSYGVPCLITKGTYLKDFVDKYDVGWSCETTVDDIASAIERAVLEKHLLKEKSQKAISAVKENFDPERIAKQTLDNYRKFI